MNVAHEQQPKLIQLKENDLFESQQNMSRPPSNLQSEVNSPLLPFFDKDTESNYSFPFSNVQDNGSVATPTDDLDLNEVFAALLNFDSRIQTPNFQQNRDKIENAIQLNDDMQKFAEAQIQRLDSMLEDNAKLMIEAGQLAIFEQRACQPFLIHKRYRNDVAYFDRSELLSPPLATVDDASIESVQTESTPETTVEVFEDDDSEEDIDGYTEEQEKEEVVKGSKIWSVKERQRLEDGVLSEAKRILCLDFVQNNEPWRFWEVEKMEKRQLTSFDVGRLDWNRISSMHVLTKTATECLMQWTTQEHPSINKRPWSKQESQKLTELVNEIGLHSGQWEMIANRLGTNRTIAQCFSHYMFEKHNTNSKKKWTAEEDARLRRAIKVFGNHNWQMVASLMENRTGQQCLHRWQKAIRPGLVKNVRWKAEEDNNLKRAVQLYGIGQWKKVQRQMPGRTDAQCRERYMNVLDPSIKREPFTKEETDKLMELVEQHGKKWSYLARLFPGRTDNNLLKQYKRVMREREEQRAIENRALESSVKENERAEPAEKRRVKRKAAKTTKRKATTKPKAATSTEATSKAGSIQKGSKRAQTEDTHNKNTTQTRYSLRKRARRA